MPTFEYQIKRSSRITKSTSISIKPDGRVIVSAPKWVPIFLIKKFVEDKSDWIEEHLKNHPKPISNTNYQTGDKIPFFGQYVEITVNSVNDLVRTSIDFNENKFQITVSNIHQEQKRHEEIKTIIERWYMQQGIAVITEKVNKYTGILGVDYSKITIKKVSSIWGSCSYQNNLSFSKKLIMAPHDIVDYVVIHEVCHIVHKNHSSRFWGLVYKLDPYYREHRGWLRKNNHLLTI